MKWTKLNLSQHTYKPIPVEDIITSKMDIVHAIAFEDAKKRAIINSKNNDGSPLFLEKYINQNDADIYVDENFNECDRNNAFYCINLDEWKFIEKNETNDSYTLPPTLICIKRNINKNNDGKPIIERHIISLSPWWDMFYNIFNDLKYDSITNNFIDEYKFNDIIQYDYCRKKATIENRVEMYTRKIPFKDIKYSDNINIGLY